MHDDFRLPQSGWIALLSIAHRYEFLNVYKRAVREIYDFAQSEYRNAEKKSDRDSEYSDLDAGSDSPDPNLDYLMLISAADKYDVPFQHVVPTFIALVLRHNPLTDAEATHLSTLTMCRLARAREYYHRRIANAPMKPNFDRHNEAEKIVREIWLPNTATKD
jgi:hypothetical protein